MEGRLSLCEAAASHGLSRQSAGKWVRRYRESGVSGLRDRSSRPVRLRQPTLPEQVARVEALRRERWTGVRIAQATGLSRATVSRILTRLKLNKMRMLEPAAPTPTTSASDRISAFRSDPAVNFVYAHTSGHAPVADLQRLAAALNPRKLVPIHSERGEDFFSQLLRATCSSKFLHRLFVASFRLAAQGFLLCALGSVPHKKPSTTNVRRRRIEGIGFIELS